MAIELHHLNTHGMMEQAGNVLDGIVRLKARIAELEAERDAFEKSFNEMSEAYMKSQRALWLARALRARDKAFEYHFNNNVEMCAKWDNVHLILMAKAEEYK